jgi:hypothetical protein
MIINKIQSADINYILLKISTLTYNPQPLPLLEPLVEPVASLEMGRVASGRASGIKFLPQDSNFEFMDDLR